MHEWLMKNIDIHEWVEDWLWVWNPLAAWVTFQWKMLIFLMLV